MSTAQASNRLILAVIASIVLGGASLAFATDLSPPAAPPAPSKEMREKMATVHERIAACLRSDRTMTECRKEMQQACQDMMGKEGCPMMGMGMHGGMMQEPPAGKPDAK